MFIIGAPYLDYYVDSFNNKYESEIRLYCKNEGIDLDYIKNLISTIIKK
ncbi:hypothetical protein GCM10008905_02460 [Clostridium malenominatum]|uniref:Uncharacterized protein n=1 Tax=Clostridium malenominatum TaxID=1539 RepID=A0ABN1ILY5_9CLOT